MTDLEGLAAELETSLPGRVARRVPFADLSTYRVGGPVAVLARVASAADLAVVATATRHHRPAVLVVGRGSNLLVADDGFAGLAIVLEGGFDSVEVSRAAGPAAVVRAGGATPLPVLARRSAAAGLTGLEFFVGIPGSVGGAVRMNAGGHGRETRDVLRRVWLVELLDGEAGAEPVERPAGALDLAYRRSNVDTGQIVVGAEFTATADDPGACEGRVAEVVRWRREHQPGGANAGSVFRNPPGDSAGRLIDAAGLKGLRVGGAVVSEKHANFFQAEPGATTRDVCGLISEVQRRVVESSGVHLVPELLVVGVEVEGEFR